MITVKKISVMTGVPSDTIRYYTKIGLLIPKRHPVNRYKIFTNHHIKLLEFIRKAKSLGFSLDEIQSILNERGKSRSPCHDVRKAVKKRLIENRKKIIELTELQHRMEKALLKWEGMPDLVPKGDSFCHLIESISDQN